MIDAPDYWTDLSELAVPPSLPGAFGQVRELGAVAPLSAFGQGDPAARALLEEALFGPAAGSETERQTFALIDAARVANLVDTLRTAGMEHACLFSGAAEAEMAEAGPWLAALDQHAAATRRFLDDPGTPWSIWGRDAAIFVRSRSDLAGLRHHSRKFVRIRDPEDRWMFLRFWDPHVLLDLAASLKPANAQTFFADHIFIAIVDDIACQVSGTAER